MTKSLIDKVCRLNWQWGKIHCQNRDRGSASFLRKSRRLGEFVTTGFSDNRRHDNKIYKLKPRGNGLKPIAKTGVEATPLVSARAAGLANLLPWALAIIEGTITKYTSSNPAAMGLKPIAKMRVEATPLFECESYRLGEFVTTGFSANRRHDNKIYKLKPGGNGLKPIAKMRVEATPLFECESYRLGEFVTTSFSPW